MGVGITGSQGVTAPLSFYVCFFCFSESLYKTQSVCKFLLPQPPGCCSPVVLSVALVAFNRDTSIFRADRVVVPLLVSAAV